MMTPIDDLFKRLCENTETRMLRFVQSRGFIHDLDKYAHKHGAVTIDRMKWLPSFMEAFTDKHGITSQDLLARLMALAKENVMNVEDGTTKSSIPVEVGMVAGVGEKRAKEQRGSNMKESEVYKRLINKMPDYNKPNAIINEFRDLLRELPDGFLDDSEIKTIEQAIDDGTVKDITPRYLMMLQKLTDNGHSISALLKGVPDDDADKKYTTVVCAYIKNVLLPQLQHHKVAEAKDGNKYDMVFKRYLDQSYDQVAEHMATLGKHAESPEGIRNIAAATYRLSWYKDEVQAELLEAFEKVATEVWEYYHPMEECVCHIYGMDNGALMNFYKTMEENYKRDGAFETLQSDKTEVEKELIKRGLLSEDISDNETREIEVHDKIAKLEEAKEPIFNRLRKLPTFGTRIKMPEKKIIKEQEELVDLILGLGHWVEDYIKARKAGNVPLTKQIKQNIDKVIKQKGFDKNKVFGDDPDRPDMQEAIKEMYSEVDEES